MMQRKTAQIIVISVLLIIALGFGVGVGVLAWIIKTAPDISQISMKPSETSTVISADGKVLASLYIENRVYVPLSKIPMDLQNAVVASEDQKFWEHHGINVWAIMRALYVDIKTGSLAQGASTITQQLARNIALTQKKKITRKIQEAYIAIQLERMFTKEEILEMFLNEIFFGHSAQGVQTAAQQYFGKNVEDLTLSESAMIIGIMPSPNNWSPYNNMERAIERRNLVLNSMVTEGYISKERAEQAKKESLKLTGLKKYADADHAPYFVRYVREQALAMFGSDTVYRGGLKIYTTLDYGMQEAAEKTLAAAIDPAKGYLPTMERQNKETPIQPQVAIISIDPRTGYIKAMVGGRGEDKFNRATQSLRQPGSAFKPLAYVTALEANYSPGDVVDDVLGFYDPSLGAPWPGNYNDKYVGPITLRDALNNSVNVATVRLLKQVKVDSAIKLAERLQFTSIVKEGNPNDRNLGFALGGLSKGVSPIELASAYGVFANSGIYIQPTAILKVEDSEGHILYQANPSKKIILNEDVAYLITDMLRTVVANGTGRRAAIPGRAVAGKTGTTSDSKDAWFVGYTPELATSVWIGEDSPRPMIYDERDKDGKLLFSEGGAPMEVSSTEATRLWGEYMREALKDKPVLEFKKPANIVSVTIDPVTGKLPNSYTPKTVSELYRKGQEPTEVEQLHQPTVKVAVDTQTGQLATENCPPEQVAEYTYQKASGVRVGPATITLEIPILDEDGEEAIEKVSYVFDAGVPVVVLDPATGVPVTDAGGNYQYQYRPTEYCTEHAPSTPVEAIETGAKKIIDTIWDFFGGSTGDTSDTSTENQ